MPWYEVGVLTTAAATATPHMSLHAAATGSRPRIYEIGFFNNAATASSVGLGRPANSPTATTSVLGQAEDPADSAALTNMDTAWSTAPTAPTNYFKRIVLPATIGAGIIWTFPKGIVLANSAYLTLFNFGAGTASALNVYMVWEE